MKRFLDSKCMKGKRRRGVDEIFSADSREP